MVGGRKVLLSIAVLSGLGFDNVLGAGRFRRQDESVSSVQGAPGGASSSSTPGQEDVVSVSPSPSTTATTTATTTTTTTTTVASVATASGDSSGSTSEGEAASRGLGPQAVSSGRLAATAQAEANFVTSIGDEYTYPGVFGAGGTLTTDTNAPTRSREPTKASIGPGTETSRGPPPAESRTTRVPPTRPGRPAVDDTDYTIGLGETTPSTTAAESSTPAESATPALAAPTPPRGGPPGGGPPRISSISITKATTENVDLGYGSQSTFVTSTRQANETFTYSPSASVSYCKPSDLTAAPTTWSVVHTSTITWYGNPEDYTPPYEPISIPQTTSSCVIPVDPPRLTISICASTGTDTKYKTCEVTTTTESYGFGVQTSATPTVVFLTTDKNPAVVYSSFRTPNYGISEDPKTRDNHASPTDAGTDNTPPPYNTPGGPQAVTDPAHRPTPTPVTVAVQPTAVVINGNTIRDNPAQPTQVVIIVGQTFTIDPTRVVGAGATIDRPSATGGAYVPTPTSTDLGGVPVVVSSSVAVIGGSSFTLGPSTTIATVSGQTFTIGPTNIAGPSQTLSLPTLPSPTEVVVAGGDLITAIGSSVLVIHGTTITYSASPHTDANGSVDSGITTIQVDDDVLTLGPGGITAQGGAVTIGGSHVSSPDETQFALVGGATITKIGASVVVIRETTYTLGPGTGTTTTVVGGESVTIAPTGVEVGTLSLGYPFGPTTVITPGAGAGGGAKATGASGDGGDGGGEEDVAGAVRPWLVGVVWGVGVAVGVGVLV